ncbi:zinc transporter ZIP3-like [Patiria miniata]|uniref:Zinc transporter ZIP1 n=1 Tax=Patiria miniata TaxID=46514 RepID=A0A914AWQ6_PATMI|nr:zinc transporter ZIP3-like [Patiria miniata]
MEIIVLKVIVLCSLFISCLVASLLPLKFVNVAIKRGAGANRRHFVERVLRFLNCFGGGVFLATCLLDLLPDVERQLSDVFALLDVRTDFPIAEFITAVGLFLILSVEQIAYDCKERASRGKDEGAVVRVEENNKEKSGDNASQLIQDDSETSPLLNHGAPRQSSPSHHRPTTDTDSDSEGSINHPSRNLGHSHGTQIDGTDALIQHTDNHDMVTSSAFRSLLLLLALSLHSVFEGLALGLQNDVAQLLGIFTAVLIHKTILALSLGINFVQSNLRPRTVIQSSICFAIMAPIGIGIGILVDQTYSSTARDLISGILQGLATGTFLYITFFEVLPMEMSQPGDRLLKVLCAIVGFSLIVGTLFLDPTITQPTTP